MNHNSTLLVSPDTAKIILEVVAGPHLGLTRIIDHADAIVVGRSMEADFCLDQDDFFSRHHFRLVMNPPECLLLDLGSRNGTFVNGEQVEEVSLQSGDLISGGDTEIRLTIMAPVRQAAHPVSPPAVTGLEVGAVLGSYEILRELGRGTMGVVYLARQRRTGRETAIKVLPSAQASTPESLQLFLREASVLSQLNHPRIVRFYELGLIDQRLFLAMEYVETISLGDLMVSERRRGTVHRACGLAVQLLDALEYTHRLGLVHRDIKPANLLILKESNRIALKLADFGLAKNYWNAGCSGVTAAGSLRGTLAYMAPEQILHCRDAQPGCDLYSTGATLYWMLAGLPPFEEASAGHTVKAVLEQEPTSLLVRRPNLPAALVQVVHCAMAKNPAARFATAREFREALRPFTALPSTTD